MSVTTTADRYVNEAREAAQTADEAIQQAVYEICAKDCYGADDLTEDFKRRLRRTAAKIAEIRDLLE